MQYWLSEKENGHGSTNDKYEQCDSDSNGNANNIAASKFI